MSAMKANLVGDEEQGKVASPCNKPQHRATNNAHEQVQGVVAALRALANAAVGFLLGNGFHAAGWQLQEPG